MELPFLTVTQVARILGVTEKSVRDFVTCGELRASKIGQWRITEDDLREFVERRSNQAIKTFLDNADPKGHPYASRLPGTMIVCVVIDYYTPAPKPLTDHLLAYVNSRSPEASFNWTYSWDRNTGRARYTVWGPPHFVARLLDTLEAFKEAVKE
jgi:excisionase family DNA binding protein